MELTYLKQPPKRYTFEQPKLKRWVEQNCKGLVLNLFAGKVRLLVAKGIRVDIDPAVNPDYCMDAMSFIEYWKENGKPKFDTVVLDPPYNLRKGREKYNGRYIGCFTKIKKELVDIIADDGIVITLGYSTAGIGLKSFKKEKLCVVCHSGDHNDTLCLLERKVVRNIINY